MSNLPDAADDPRDVAATRYDAAFIQSVDDQIQGLARDVVPRRNQSWVSAFPKADPDAAALTVGTIVALKASSTTEPLMVAATAANIAAGAKVLGVLVASAPPGQRGEVAVGGCVPASITGLSGGEGVVGANDTTAAAELGSANAIVGVATAGNMLVLSAPTSAAQQTQQIIQLADATAKTVALDPTAASVIVANGGSSLSADCLLTFTGVSLGRVIKILNATIGGAGALKIPGQVSGPDQNLGSAAQWICSYIDTSSIGLGTGPGWAACTGTDG